MGEAWVLCLTASFFFSASPVSTQITAFPALFVFIDCHTYSQTTGLILLDVTRGVGIAQ